ncbi:glycosyltransferase [Aquabacterium sp. A7-Y]|uniref:glycosyltransferase n=1 Tax=Aquabacterium sp. A7-Y TaxID=1349605 RepID=UPI00223D27DD|nr:glycosyltransferase [Aquabacterium sp. A7-Y]MCW7536373.1 glycosyltransferase [Aquabacterium sp. A7-Y]
MASTHTPEQTHVLQIVGNAIVGGMETYVSRLIERLPRERFRVTALCPWESPFSEQLRALDAEVLIVPMPDDPPWASIQTTAALIRAQGIDVVQAHLPNAHLLAALAGRLTETPVLATVHGRQLHVADLEAHRLAGTHLSVVCQYTYYHALTLGVAAAQLHLIPNGADLEVFRPQRVRDGALRQRFGIAAEAPLVGFVGRLSWEKGPESFLRAALIAHGRCPEARFVLVGDGPMAQQCARFIESFGMSGYAHLAGLQADMPAVFAELDLVVSTSHTEAMPLALMEAMACGLPVVATRVGGVPDMVQHSLTGALVSPGDFDGMGALIVKLLGQPETLRSMGQHARERAERHFNLAEGVAATGDLLARLARGVRTAPAPRPSSAGHAAALPGPHPAKPANGHAGAHANGHTNGHANGHAAGHPTGHAGSRSGTGRRAAAKPAGA